MVFFVFVFVGCISCSPAGHLSSSSLTVYVWFDFIYLFIYEIKQHIEMFLFFMWSRHAIKEKHKKLKTFKIYPDTYL